VARWQPQKNGKTINNK